MYNKKNQKKFGFKMCQNLFVLHYERQSIEPFSDIVCP